MRATWLTSFDDNALLVKSLQHVLKHFSTTVAYIRKKSCICHIRLRFERDFKQEKYNTPASFQWFCSFALALRCWSLKNPCQWRNVKRYLNLGQKSRCQASRAHVNKLHFDIIRRVRIMIIDYSLVLVQLDLTFSQKEKRNRDIIFLPKLASH